MLQCAWHMFGFKSTKTRIRCQNQTSLIRFQKREWDGFEQKPICLLFFFFFFYFSLPCSFPCFFFFFNFFKAELMSNICLDAGSASDFMSCESGRGGPWKTKVYNHAWKVNTFCIQNRRAHLVTLSLRWSVFLLLLSRYRPLHLPKQTRQG